MGVTPSRREDLSRRRQADGVHRAARSRSTWPTAIVKVQRDFGNRADRKVARLKYLIAQPGPRLVQSQGRRILRQAACRAEPGRRAGLRRPHGLARTRRRPLVLRPEHRKRPPATTNDDVQTEGGSARRSASTLKPGIRLTAAPEHFVHRLAGRRSRARSKRSCSKHGVKLSRGDLERAPLVDGLRGLSHVRPGDHRKRTSAARHHRSNSKSNSPSSASSHENLHASA